MSDESKPPMRQIAELIEGIATARAESAESLLTMCEHQLTLARRDTSDLRSILDDQARSLDGRDAEIARISAEFESEQTLRQCRDEQLRLLHQDYAGCVRERNEARHEVETWQREYSGALADFEHAQAEIARLKEHVDAANATASDVIREATVLRRANAQLDAEIARLETELAEQRADRVAALGRYLSEWDAGRVPIRIEPAPPAEDPRIAALCRVVAWAVNRQWSYTVQHCPTVRADLETIVGNR